jgi:thiamine transporter ThiT
MNNELKCWCKHCKAELPPSHTGPCPKCGKLGKDCKVTATVAIKLAVSVSAQKVHKYTKKHPRFIAISIVVTVTALVLGYHLGGLFGLLIGIIAAVLNWWLTPRAIQTIQEIRHYGEK